MGDKQTVYSANKSVPTIVEKSVVTLYFVMKPIVGVGLSRVLDDKTGVATNTT